MTRQSHDAHEVPRIAVTGSSGFVGTALAGFLSGRGYRVDALVRRTPRPDTTEIEWDPAGGRIDASKLEGVDGVIHLAGENLASGRWTRERKLAIERSRVDGTRLLCEALARLERRPRFLISASAIGYYGPGDRPVDESSRPGHGFLSEVCSRWEAATEPARHAGVRVACLRMGLVLARDGGVLAKMLTPFRFGTGGAIGNGRQYMSWIALTDLVHCVEHIILHEQVSGPVNAVAPQPVTNNEFTATLARVLNRPALLRMPATAVRLMFGEMGQALMLEGAWVLPVRLQAAGFEFRFPDLESALRHEIGDASR